MLFGVAVPKSSEVTVKIRIALGRGKPLIAWQGCGDVSEAEVLEAICKSPVVCTYLNRASQGNRLRADEDGSFKVPVKIASYLRAG